MNATATNAGRLAASLQRNGVRYVFGQSNPPSITLACADIGIEQIGYRQENAGTYMAQAYGMCTQTIPVVTAQHGPAATLLVPGLAESLKASYPIVALVEEIGLNHVDKNAFQEIDHQTLFQGVTKWVKRIPTQERVEEYVDRAFAIAGSGRPGPVVLLCPKDLFNDFHKYPVNTKRVGGHSTFPLDRFSPDKQTIAQAAKLILSAKRPLIYAGGGVISSQAIAELRALQDDFSIPVATTTMGKGSVDEEHPLSIGPIGYYMGKTAVGHFHKPMIQQSDLILLVGNRTNQNGTDTWSLLPEEATYIHIDIDPEEIDRNYPSVRMIGDAKATLQALYDALQATGANPFQHQRANIEKTIQTAKDYHTEAIQSLIQDNPNTMNMETFSRKIDPLLDNDSVIVADASLSSVWNANYLTARASRKFIFPRGLAGLGWGLPMAMGAKLANPRKKVFCLVGDGGFAHVWSELETCKRHGIEIVVVVINNQILGYQKLSETVAFNRSTNVCDFSAVDHTKIAEACGLQGIKLDQVSDIYDTMTAAFRHEGTVVIDLIANPDNIPPVASMESYKREVTT
ncbi:acetolactate synthase catalytic subunit [Shouchella sp. JSM 1781072]|uniref:acetolactate synthase catalytic subunit n=1 Tax=Shouchella sp. JSM 1781072 TaxID=3344581 RepID=UPI0035BEE1F5